MSTESLHGRSEAYRAAGERMRRLAARLQFSEARRELLDLAERFDRLAMRAEAAVADDPVDAKPSGPNGAAEAA